jgi:hypothetical protein
MPVVKLKDLAASVERRKAQLGISGADYVCRNSGENRSAEKRALLRAIEAGSAAQGKRPAFEARYQRDQRS